MILSTGCEMQYIVDTHALIWFLEGNHPQCDWTIDTVANALVPTAIDYLLPNFQIILPTIRLRGTKPQ